MGNKVDDLYDAAVALKENVPNIASSYAESVGDTFDDSAMKDFVDRVSEPFDDRKTNEVKANYTMYQWETPIGVVGGIAGAFGGWKLGEKFGTIGKIIGGVGLAVAGTQLGKVVREVSTDVGAAQDYAREAEKKGAKGNFAKALWSNLTNFGGQTCDGATGSEVDSPSM